MKKKTISLMLAVVAMLTSLVFTSCGGDDDGGGDGDEPATYSAQIDYVLPLTKDMVDLFNMTVTYYDASAGKEVSEQVTKTNWTKSITAKTLPAKAYLKLNMTSKPDAKVAGESFTVSRAYTINLVRYKNGQKDGFESMPGVGSSTMGADKLAKFVETYCAGKPYVNSVTAVVTKDGFTME